jgi:hypothetical protein
VIEINNVANESTNYVDITNPLCTHKCVGKMTSPDSIRRGHGNSMFLRTHLTYAFHLSGPHYILIRNPKYSAFLSSELF